MGALLRGRSGRVRLRQVLGDADPRGDLTVQSLAQEEVHDPDQRRPRQEESPGVEQGETEADGGTPRPAARGGHGMRYPTPGTVSMTGGSPSFRRSIMTVNRTTPVNGSAGSSHAFSRSCS